MSPNACRLCQIFCVEVTSAPMLMPVRLPLNPPLAAIHQRFDRAQVSYHEFIHQNREHILKRKLESQGNDIHTNSLCDAEGQPDAGVGEGHDGGEDGEPGDLVEVGDLR